MNKNLIRAAVVVCLLTLIPNIANAFYAAHMGRWTSRDPLVERIGGSGFMTGDSFVSRDGRLFDSSIQSTGARNTGAIWNDGYVDGYNLYEYVGSGPLTGSDPSGLQWGGIIRWILPKVIPKPHVDNRIGDSEYHPCPCPPDRKCPIEYICRDITDNGTGFSWGSTYNGGQPNSEVCRESNQTCEQKVDEWNSNNGRPIKTIDPNNSKKYTLCDWVLK